MVRPELVEGLIKEINALAARLDVVRERAAGETPPAEDDWNAADWSRDPRPHSRACGIQPHPHGPLRCAGDCPTCHRTPGGTANPADIEKEN